MLFIIKIIISFTFIVIFTFSKSRYHCFNYFTNQFIFFEKIVDVNFYSILT